jgi:tRNA threonylcarbamoyladenosine biosynthesis protein TsaE
MSNFIDYSLSETQDAAAFLIEKLSKNVVAIKGEMGAGKTTFIKSLCKYLHVQDEVSSPTFGLVNQYQTASNTCIYHFDFYRIKSIEEVYDIGYEDYFYSGNLCLIEWPEMVAEFLDEAITQHVEISLLPDGRRRLMVY